MRTLFQRKHGKKIELNESDRGTVSTLLIPEKWKSKLEKRYGKGKMKKTFRYFLENYRGFLAIGNLPFSGKPKTRFQEENLDLKPVKFRPDDGDWFEFGILAYGLGVSRCWLFSYLLELDFSETGKFFRRADVKVEVATPASSRPRQILQISGRRRFIERILHFRI